MNNLLSILSRKTAYTVDLDYSFFEREDIVIKHNYVDSNDLQHSDIVYRCVAPKDATEFALALAKCLQLAEKYSKDVCKDTIKEIGKENIF